MRNKIQIAFINNDKNSKFFKKNFSMILEENDNIQILVPPKYGVAHLYYLKKLYCIINKILIMVRTNSSQSIINPNVYLLSGNQKK